MAEQEKLTQLEDLLVKLKNLQANGDSDEVPLQTSLPEIISHLEECELILKNSKNTEDTVFLERVWNLVTQASEMCANAAKIESSRTPLGVSGAIALLTSFLDIALPGPTLHLRAEVQCLRSLGNLCYDHVDNRKRVMEADGVRVILEYIKVSTGSSSMKFSAYEVLRTACGALMNVSLKYEPVQEAIIKNGGVPVLAELLDPQRLRNGGEPAARTATLAARIMAALVALSDGRQAFAKSAAIVRVIDLIKYVALEEQSKELELLEELVEIADLSAMDSDEIQITIATNTTDMYFVLLDFLEHAQPPRSSNSNEEEEEEEEDGESDERRFQDLKIVMARAAVSVTLNDQNMDPLFDNAELMTRLLRWLRDTERDDLQMTAALCLGNLARSDTHSLDLVQNHHVELALVPLLQRSKDARVLNAAVGLLKNLSLPKENKRIIGATGVTTRAAELLAPEKDMLKPIQYGIVGILKHLSTGNLENAKLLAQPPIPTPLDAILALAFRTDDQPTKLESSRVLVNLIKTVWAAEPATTRDTRRAILERDKVPAALVTMIRAGERWPVLVNEGVFSLTLLVTDDDEEGKVLSVVREAEEAGEAVVTGEGKEAEEDGSQKRLLDVLAEVMKDGGAKYADEIKSNVCLLLKKMGEKSKEGNPALYVLLQAKLKPSLEQVASNSSTSSPLRDVAQAAVDVL